MPEYTPRQLKELRLSAKLTLTQLAKKLNLGSHVYLSRIESGEQRPSQRVLDMYLSLKQEN